MMAAGPNPVTRPFPMTLFFALDGIVFATWAVRIPSIKDNLDVSTSGLGVALLCMSIGVVAAMAAGGRLCIRFGTRAVTLVAFSLICLMLPLPALAESVPVLGAILAVFGIVYGALNIALNSGAVELEAAMGKPIMSPMHGIWSAGGLLGALLGGLLVGHLSVVQHFIVIGALGLVLTACTTKVMLHGGTERTSEAGSPAAGNAEYAEHVASNENTGSLPKQRAEQPVPTGSTLVRLGIPVVICGLAATCSAFGEGAVSDWGVLHLRDGLDASASTAAYGFAAYSVAIAGARLIGSQLIQRLGETAVLSFGSILAAGGILLAAWTESVPMAFLGFVVVGLGLANVFPIAIARGGALGGPNGVSLASSIGHAGMLGGPPLIGFLADRTSLPAALSSVAVSCFVIVLLALALRARSGLEAEAAGPVEPQAPSTTTDTTDTTDLTDLTDTATPSEHAKGSSI